jgi:hypothetical protein
MSREQPSERHVKILLRTNSRGRVEVVDVETNQVIKGIGRVSLYVDSFKKPRLEIEFKDVEINIGVEDVKYGKRNQNSK